MHRFEKFTSLLLCAGFSLSLMSCTAKTTATESSDNTNVFEATTTVETTVPKATAEDIINILVVGQSSRAGEESRMADTTMVVSINTFDGTVTVFSVLRDSYVKLPDYKGHVCGRAKFTVCYGLGYQWGGTAGAMEMTNNCMRDNFGVEVDYNFEISNILESDLGNCKICILLYRSRNGIRYGNCYPFK